MKLSKTYEPDKFEPTIYALWETSGAFMPTGKGDPYSIVMPPPNANGNLHVGHAYMIPIEDILTRYYRMNGRDTVWVPGADHAGFETWVVFERALNADGKSRFDYSREQLYQMTWDFVERNRGNMELQIRALGASCDWSSTVFTLDKKVIETVYQTFHKLWNDGLVYRGNRIVNYCPHHQTSFADIEVEYRDERSHLWHIKYQLTSGEGEVEVATTRPETMLGDVAIAVHPDDPKYQNMIGKSVIVPLVNREIPIIADEGVELGFGTGAVKITPAHDPLDFEIGQRHHLPQIQIIGLDGKITEEAPEKYRGMTPDDARIAVVDDLDACGALGRVEDFQHQVPHCYKCGSTIQPLLMKQWFINVKPLAKRAREAVADGKIRFVPAQKGYELAKYYDELRDWNISRQIPWGIPIPAFQNIDDPDDWIFDTRVEQKEIEVNGQIYHRDEDTFDTWFSSGQWPFVTTDYLTDGKLSKFYPNAVMETGVDILRAWVARMIMLGLYTTNKVPFRDVFLHGLILDEHGQKMSKSKGNVVNPMEIIAKYGSDALRIGIVMNRSAGQAQAFSEASVIAGRNFCNKLWNIARYIEDKADTAEVTNEDVDQATAETIADHWILAKLEQARVDISDHIANYRFAEAMETVYHVIWDYLADWYIEASKVDGNPAFMRHVLNIALRLVHPFAPFVTETTWTTIRGEESLLISQPWPQTIRYNHDKADDFEQVIELVDEIRNIISQLPNRKYRLVYDDEPVVGDNRQLIATLAKLKDVKHDGTPNGLKIVLPHSTTWLELLTEEIQSYKDDLQAKLDKIKNEVYALERRLNNTGYVEKAPEQLVNETRKQLADKKRQTTHIAEQISAMD
ncbi:MAG: valine--tRNA ligase [Candidatus Saccharibacteria bacterium]|nr:valine--tRNA ligase [Candidatus Saccharibacteria bacterium]